MNSRDYSRNPQQGCSLFVRTDAARSVVFPVPQPILRRIGREIGGVQVLLVFGVRDRDAIDVKRRHLSIEGCQSEERCARDTWQAEAEEVVLLFAVLACRLWW